MVSRGELEPLKFTRSTVAQEQSRGALVPVTQLAPSTAARFPVHMFDDGPRVLDTDLAQALGMMVPRKIRSDIIDANSTELCQYGNLRRQRLQTGGRPADAYYLNEEQALLVCVLSRTEAAKLVRAELIQVFMAYRRGELVRPHVPALPDFSNPAEAARAWADQFEKRQMIEAQLAEAAPKLEFYDEFATADGHLNLRQVAKVLGSPERAFAEILVTERVLYRTGAKRGLTPPGPPFSQSELVSKAAVGAAGWVLISRT
jgi:hypothetical protein